MEHTKIEWCDDTWNPVSGCLHGCEYCYARRIAARFGLHRNEPDIACRVLEGPAFQNGRKVPYPFDFQPTFHSYRLNDYLKKKGRNIFVCSMADLFGAWVPDAWKMDVLQSCYAAPQHHYLFLTKDPIGYSIWPDESHPGFSCVDPYTENMWLGVTYTGNERLEGHYSAQDVSDPMSSWTNFWYLWRMSDSILPTRAHKFLSIEPLGCDICEAIDEREGGRLLEHFLLPRNRKSYFEWVIVGAETGKREGKVIPKREWIEKLVTLCHLAGIPLFMKSSLCDVWGDDLIQEFPDSLLK